MNATVHDYKYIKRYKKPHEKTLTFTLLFTPVTSAPSGELTTPGGHWDGG